MRIFSRFEMWCRRQATAAILALLFAGWLTGESSEALTTFGKSDTQPPKDTRPIRTSPPAKICTSQRDCAGISGVTCVRTHYESQTRCLCGDNTPPVNGHCEASTKTLYHLCATSDECNDGLICGSPNITQGVPVPLHLRPFSSNDHICLCDSENGYREKDYACGDADAIQTSFILMAVALSMRKMLTF